MIVLLHGWSQDETSLRSAAKKLGGEALCLRGGHPVKEGGFSWTSWESDDPREIQRARRRVAASLPRGAVLFGFSQGGMLALELGFAGDVPLRAVVTVGAYLAAGGLARPRARVRRGPPLLLLHGEQDPYVPPLESAKALARLGRFAPRAEMQVVAGGHEVTAEMLAIARRFLRKASGPR